MLGCGFNSLYCSNLVDFTKAEQKKFSESKIVSKNPISILDPDKFDKKDPVKTVAKVAVLATMAALTLKYGKKAVDFFKKSGVKPA